MRDYKQVIISDIFSKAETILKRINKNSWGYLALYQAINNQLELLQIGKLGSIKQKKDPEFGTISKKLQHYAGKKCLSIFETPGAITSGITSFGIKGAIKVNNSLILGFSGMEQNQDEDETLVVATIHSLKDYLNEKNILGGDGPLIKLIDFHFMSDNPMLSDDNIMKLIYGY